MIYLNVVQCVGHAVQLLEEGVVENVLGLRAHPQLHGLVVGRGVHCLGRETMYT